MSGPAAVSVLALAGFLVVCYLVGSIPWSYLIVRWVFDEDISEHGSGNVGAMNVKRTTGSWGWFAVAMVADCLKGLVPVAMAKGVLGGFGIDWLATPWAYVFGPLWRTPVGGLALLPMLAVFGAVLGHNYSAWLALTKRRFGRTGKGLATGAGALIVYDWRYGLICLAVALTAIAVTRIMMAGQVGAAIALPVAAVALRSPDWPFALLMGLIVYSAHHRRFVGMLRGEEPRLYTQDAMGPRG